MFNLTSETDEATEVITELGSFVHPVSDIISDIHQTTAVVGDNGMSPIFNHGVHSCER